LVRLGEIYLSNNELENALVIFDALEKAGEVNKSFQVCGYAGKLIVYSRSATMAGGQQNQSALINKYFELLANQVPLLNSYFKQEIDKIYEGLAFEDS
jgi:hypothetical protein